MIFFIQVNALLSVNEGAHFGGVNQPFVAEKLRLGPQGATSLVVRLIATAPGLKNITGKCLNHTQYSILNFVNASRTVTVFRTIHS